MMVTAPVGEWAPDNANVDQTILTVARNVLPSLSGYGPLKSLQPYSVALGAQCVGGFCARLNSGAYAIFAGTTSKIYRLASGGASWTDVSGAFTFNVPDADLWSFAQFGTKLIATNANLAAPVVIDVDSGSAFTSLGGSPPAARGVATVGDFLLLYGLPAYPRRIVWSAINNITGWTAGVDLSGYQEFPDGGDVTGFAGNEYGVVSQANAVRRMIRTPEEPLSAFRFVKVTDTVGGFGFWSATRSGDTVFMCGPTGFYAFGTSGGVPVGGGTVDAGGMRAISSGRVTDWFFKTVDINAIGRMLCVSDTSGTRIFWYFKSTDGANATLYDKALVYDWKLDKFAYFDCSVEYVMPAATVPISLDSETGSLDSESGTLDDPALNASVYQLGAFRTTHDLGFYTGPNEEALIETSDGFIGRPGIIKVTGLRPDIDALTHYAALGSKMQLGAPLAYSPEVRPSADGVCHLRRAYRFHRARVRVPAGEAWNYIRSIDVHFEPAGVR